MISCRSEALHKHALRKMTVTLSGAPGQLLHISTTRTKKGPCRRTQLHCTSAQLWRNKKGHENGSIFECKSSSHSREPLQRRGLSRESARGAAISGHLRAPHDL